MLGGRLAPDLNRIRYTNAVRLTDLAPVDQAEAALKKLREAPGDKEALTKLERAVQRLKEAGIKAEGDRGRPGQAKED
jgi:hypothetical protein